MHRGVNCTRKRTQGRLGWESARDRWADGWMEGWMEGWMGPIFLKRIK